MRKCTVVGSGPSGVHFALTALQKGHDVEMIDVGMEGPEQIHPTDTFEQLKSSLDDPASYFLGENNQGVLLPGAQEEFYGIPPSKSYALKEISQHRIESHNFNPMTSFARGGLAQMWTGGCYPFNNDELSAYPFDYSDLAPAYSQIAKRIGINGTEDDLSSIVPVHEHMQQPLRLDEHSALLLSSYKKNRNHIQDKLGCSMGHARLAVLSNDMGTRKACQYLGRCLWGCPSSAIYSATSTLDECKRYPGFTYKPQRYVTHFDYDDQGHINELLVESTEDGKVEKIPVDKLILAGGTLGTSKILMQSVFNKTGEVIKLGGLMDNRQVLMPFLNLRMISKPYAVESYQYNQLAMELDNDSAEESIHCLVTTLKTAMIHPVIEKFPLDLRTSLFLFKHIHAALGVVNVNFHDRRRDDSYLTLDVDSDKAHPKLVINYSSPQGEAERIAQITKRIKKVLWKLGCIVPPGMQYTREMGASVHYAGTIPMSAEKRPWSVTADCKSHDFDNLTIADGATLPFLPAKNLTFTLMANASRVAENLD